MARILVVDDDPDIRFVARLALKRGKHEVTVAESGRAAIAHRSEEHTSELQSRLHLVCRLLLEKKTQPPRRTVRPTPPGQHVPSTRPESRRRSPRPSLGPATRSLRCAARVPPQQCPRLATPRRR